MTSTIDNRVVEMNFDNKQFEQGVSTSVKSIDTLKKSLNFENAINNTKALSSAIAGFSLGKMADGIGSIANRFSAFGIMGMTILQNLTNSAINFGKKLLASVTVDPIKTGLTEYETLMNSVQTIMANTSMDGTTLEEVNDALKKMNDYSDQTIYNFSQMARNVGTFTAAGLSLDTSVQAIKGIANLAAVSGSNAEQASTAMYQLSQALATGTVRLQDWISVNNAGMGGKIFQESLKESARVHGIAIDDIIKKEGSFRESLQTGWLSSEILTETLAKFTGELTSEQLTSLGYTEEQIKQIEKLGVMATDAATKVKTFTQLTGTIAEAAQSGWAQTWQIIIGDFEEAKALFTGINNVLTGFIGASAKNRNELLQAWKDMGGRNIALKALRDIFYDIMGIIKPISEAFREIFPPTTVLQLMLISVNLQRLAAHLKMGARTAEKVKTVFKGVFAVFDIVRMIIVAVVREVLKFTKHLDGAGKSVLDFLVPIAEAITRFRDMAKNTDLFTTILDTFGSKVEQILGPLPGKFKEFFLAVVNGFKSIFDVDIDMSGTGGKLTAFIDELKKRFQPLSAVFNAAKGVILFFMGLVNKLAPAFAKLGSIAADGMGIFIDALSNALNNIDPERMFAIINGALIAGLLKSLKNFVDKGTSALKGVVGILDGVRGSLVAYQNNLKANVLLKQAIAIGILAISLIALSTIDGAKLATALGAMTAMFIEMGLAMSAFSNTAGGIKGTAVMSTGIIAIATAMLIFAGAVKILGTMDADEISKGMLAIGAISVVMVTASKLMSNSSANLIKGSVGLIAFSVAVRVMTGAIRKLGKIDVNTLNQGLLAFGAILGGLAIFMRTTDLGGMGISKAVGILILAGAINVIAIAIQEFGNMDPDKLNQGLMTLGKIMLGMAVFIASVSGMGPTSLISLGVGFGLLSGSLVVLTGVLQELGTMSTEEISNGLLALGGALAIITAAMLALPKDMLFTAASLLVVSGALYIIGQTMTQMGGMSWDEIARGLTVLAGSLLIIGVAMYAMTTALPGALAMIIIAGALMMLAPALETMGNMSWEEIARGLVALAGTFTVLGLAAYVLTPMIPSLFGLAGALVLLGIAALATGAGVLALSVGLAGLAVSGAAGAASLVILLTSIISLIPMLFKQLGKALLVLIDTLVEGAPTLLAGIVSLLDILFTGLALLIPKIVAVVVLLVEKIVAALVRLTPKLVKAGWSILMALLGGIADHIEDLVKVTYDIITGFIDGISASLPQIAEAGWNLIISYIDSLTASVEKNMPRIMESTTKLGFAIVKGLAQGIVDSRKIVLDAIKDIAMGMIDAIKDLLGIKSPSTVFLDIGIKTIQGLINGIISMVTTLKTTLNTLIRGMITTFLTKAAEFYKIGVNYITRIKTAILNTASLVITQVRILISSLIKAFTDKVGEFMQIGTDIVIGIKDGIKDAIWMVLDEAYNLATQVIEIIKNIFDQHSPSKVMMDIGKNFVEGFAIGIDSAATSAYSSAATLASETIAGFSNAITAINDFVGANIDMSPTIRPVLDLSDIKKEGSKIADYIDTKGFTVPVSSVNLAVSTSNNMNGVVTPETKVAQPGETKLNFVQNNYSPKALSRFELYRQTRNQLRMLEQAKGLTG